MHFMSFEVVYNIDLMIVPGLVKMSFIDSMLSRMVTLRSFCRQLRRLFSGGRNTLCFHHKNSRPGAIWSFGMALI